LPLCGDAKGTTGADLTTAEIEHAEARQPAGLATLFMVELWERFSYYGMRALLVLFMVAPVASGGLGFDTVQAAMIYGNYTMAVYLLSIPGGYVADHLLGARRAVFIGGLVIASGHFSLAVPHMTGFALGLILIALGTGLFKPSISAMVGGLYAPNDARRDGGFSIFYMGINIGALAAPFVTGFLAQSAAFKGQLSSWGLDPAMSWHWGFAAAGVGMTLSVALFARRLAQFRTIGSPPVTPTMTARSASAVMGGSATLLALLLLSDRAGLEWLRYAIIVLPVAAIVYLVRREDLESRRIAAVFVLFVSAMIFWAAFEQAGLSIALFAHRLTDNQFGAFTIPSAWYQSLNPLFVILLAPLFASLWTRLGSRQPSTPAKFVLGLFFLALSFLLMVPAAYLTIAGKVSPLWLVGLFLLQTIGELCLSPVGLSAMTKLAPARMVGLMLGIWFLGAAFGNKLSGVLGAGFTSDDPEALAAFFLNLAALAGTAMLALIVLTPWLKRLMGDVR
jgi:proton-dependent oligopeptide transporter, POT family